jgi:hypothetical protein
MASETDTRAEPRQPRPQQMPTRQPLPGSIWIYIAVLLLIYLVGGLWPGDPALAFDGRLAVTTFFRLLFIFLLINRSTIGLILAAAFEAMAIVLLIVTLEPPATIKLGVLMFLHSAALALLLTRATRVYVRSSS